MDLMVLSICGAGLDLTAVLDQLEFLAAAVDRGQDGQLLQNLLAHLSRGGRALTETLL